MKTTCPICGCPSSLEFFQKAPRTLLICEYCRHIFWQVAPRERDLAAHYRTREPFPSIAGAVEDTRAYFREHLSALARLLRTRPGTSAVLDVDCANPLLIEEAHRLGFRDVLSVHYSEMAVEQGARLGVEILRWAELDSLPANSFDIVRFSHSLEHYIDPRGALRCVLTKVRPGGLVYITQPNFPVFRYQASSRDLKDSVFPEHLHFFSPISLLGMVSELGLRVHQFFTHQNEQAVFEAYRSQIDVEYATLRLKEYEERGESAVAEPGKFPVFSGENSVLYAFKS